MICKKNVDETVDFCYCYRTLMHCVKKLTTAHIRIKFLLNLFCKFHDFERILENLCLKNSHFGKFMQTLFSIFCTYQPGHCIISGIFAPLLLVDS